MKKVILSIVTIAVIVFSGNYVIDDQLKKDLVTQYTENIYEMNKYMTRAVEAYDAGKEDSYRVFINQAASEFHSADQLLSGNMGGNGIGGNLPEAAYLFEFQETNKVMIPNHVHDVNKEGIAPEQVEEVRELSQQLDQLFTQIGIPDELKKDNFRSAGMLNRIEKGLAETY